MPAIGRNDACPCGSGKKYKKCCLASGALEPPFGEVDVTTAWGLVEQTLRDLEEVDYDRVADEFVELVPDTDVFDQLEEAEQEQLLDLQHQWMFFDREWKAGERLVDRVLAAGVESARARAYLEAAAATTMRLWDVEEVHDETTVTLRDRISGESRRVRVPYGVDEDVVGLGGGARVLPKGTTGIPEVDGAFWPVECPDELEQLVRDLLAEDADSGDADGTKTWRSLPQLVLRDWVAALVVEDAGTPE